jgi:hypothetical protein
MRAHYLVATLIITLSSFGIQQAFYIGLASFHNYSVFNKLKHWQKSPFEHTFVDYSRIKKKAEKAVTYHPNNAEYWDLKAQVHEWGVLFGYENHENALLEVKKQYLRATELRPLWPETWASLIKLKWRLQEFDEQMLAYFKQATTLGPQKPKVHLVVIELGLALYANNHPMLLKIRQEFYHRLVLGLRHSQTRSKVRTLISQYDSQTIVCRWLRHEDINTKKLIPNCT